MIILSSTLCIGLLDPPSWSSVEFNGNNLTLQWDQPHSLHNVPIMGYRVIVQSTTVIISDNTTSSLTMENIGSSNCTNVETSISALNSVGYSVTNTRAILHPGGEHGHTATATCCSCELNFDLSIVSCVYLLMFYLSFSFDH